MSKSNYLIPVSHPRFLTLLERFAPVFKAIEDEPAKKLVVNIPPELYNSENNTMWGEMLGIAEHNTKWIELLLFGAEFSFTKIADSELLYSEGEWQSDKNIQHWLRQIGKGIPFSFFFLSQWEARLLSIIGDLIHEPDSVRTQGDVTHAMFSFNKKQQNIIDDRIGKGCQLFMHFCDGTGFDPKQAIEAILAEFKVWYEYENVLEQFEKDVKVGFEFRLGFDGEEPKF